MSRIKNIVFDFGAVLVDWNPHHLYDKYFGSSEKTDWFLKNICTMSWNVQMDGGKPFAQGIAELSAEHPEWTKEIRMYFDRWIEMMRDEIPGMRDIILSLKDAGYGVFGLSNWSLETFCQVRHKYAIFDMLDGMVISGEEGIVKPEREIFRRLTERYSLISDECLFIDDVQANVDGAERAGLHGVLFRGAGPLREELSRLGIL